jgi:hypothetical protein
MLGDDGSGLRDEDKNKARVLIALRVPPSLAKYVDDRSKEQRGGKTRVLEDALQIHRHMFERLAKDRVRIQLFAINEGLEWPKQEAEVYARLIQRGLDEAERRRK